MTQYIILYIILFLLILIFLLNKNDLSTNDDIENNFPYDVNLFIGEALHFRQFNEELYDNFIDELYKYYEHPSNNEITKQIAITSFYELSFSMPYEISLLHYESVQKLCVLMDYNEDNL